ncbi:unnamed protein product [[Candida] boidinii]|uniref:Unnamed protein product n=1 Tax=Candida boidinii TaxID=5477 RepID=A0A9W6WAR6_CANBO|nr:hypothetical protein BVG19_g4490 [[Candida] boidinii]OWB52109.1 hypothetical protein B5S27_g3681 [[Candida] boidinii]OWB68725.1 hypothetical protein B5S30_g4111 [[Candida] boidinii]OWB86206.1 hypothetical protein B5S33_g4889 [[Candida] boidinii]GME72706.1 unnamed protein product [[Candida] boidinii]
MKLFTSNQTFNYPWGQVTAANWQKYPNEYSTQVVAVDVLRREFDDEKGLLTTERLITCKQPIPSWLRMIVGAQECSYVREVSIVDREQQTLVMRSCNLTYNNLLRVYETVIYKPDSNEPNNKTNFKQFAEITAYASFKRICDKLEDWSVERFGQNAKKGKLGFESVLEFLDAKWRESGMLIDEVTGKTSEVLLEMSDKTNEVLHEVSTNTTTVLEEVTSKVTSGIFKKY